MRYLELLKDLQNLTNEKLKDHRRMSVCLYRIIVALPDSFRPFRGKIKLNRIIFCQAINSCFIIKHVFKFAMIFITPRFLIFFLFVQMLCFTTIC